MKKSKKLLLLFTLIIITASVFAPISHTYAQSYKTESSDLLQDLHIDKDGKASMRQAKIVQVAGTTFYARYYIGLAFIRIVVKTDNNTKVYRRFGDQIALENINAGDTVNVEGQIENGADTISIVANKIVNFSNQKEVANFSGLITGFGSTTGSFILTTQNQGNITLNTNSNTQIIKGGRVITPNLLKIGDNIIQTTGTFDHASSLLEATSLSVYINKNVYVAKNFQGTLKSLPQGGAGSMMVNIDGVDYSIVLNTDTKVMSKTKKPVSLIRFVTGDTIRIYGKIREAEEPIIDAEIIRNISI